LTSRSDDFVAESAVVIPADTSPHPTRALSKVLTSALLPAIVIGALLEFTVFRHADMLADRSTVVIAYKGSRLEQGQSERVVFIGPSTALAIDGSSLQRALSDSRSVYNYAVPNLGSNEQYYFILKKYLRFNQRPDRLVLALPPDSLLATSGEQADPFIQEIERQRFRRFFGARFLLTDVAPATGRWSFVTEAAANLLPSINYRAFIKSGTLDADLDPQSTSVERLMALERGTDSVWSVYKRNRRIVSRLEATNGQLVYNGDHVVGAPDVLRTLPPPPATDRHTTKPIERVIDLARSSGIPVTLIFTPMCCERAARMEETGTWKLLEEQMRVWAQQYHDFRFAEAGPRSYEREFFGDPVHLNEQGARRFNAELVARAPEVVTGQSPR
jgi:hypothetical protein